jgi:hypothetical protein
MLLWCKSQFFVTKVQGKVFTHFHAFAVKLRSSCAELAVQSARMNALWTVPFMSKKTMSILFVVPFFFGHSVFGLFHSNTFERPMLSSPNAYLIIARASVTLFPRLALNLMHSHCRCHCKISSGQIHDSK